MKIKYFLGGLLVICLISTFSACGSKATGSKEEYKVENSLQDSNGGYGDNKGENITENVKPTEPNPSTETLKQDINLKNEQKIIYRADLFIETLEFEKAISQLEKSIKDNGAYIETSNILQNGVVEGSYKQNRNAEFVIRVPKDKFQDFLSASGSLGIVTNKRIYGEDISSQYYDKEARIKVLKVQEERYLDILAGAKDIKEILEIEKSLIEVRYEIESLTGYLNQMENLVSYSTINVNLIEVNEAKVLEATPKNFYEKVIKAFTDSLKSLKVLFVSITLFLVALIPYGFIFTIIGYIVYVIYNKYWVNKR